jgi:hypothetical protein
MLASREVDGVTPLCPHCSEGLQELWFRELRSLLGRRYVYFCPRCHKVLGVTHRKGFWMG